MGLRLQTALARRRMRQMKKRHTYWPLAFVVLFFALPAVILIQLRPKLAVYAVNYVEYQATSMMEQSVAACATEMEDIGALKTDDNGSVTSLTMNAAVVNQLRTKIVQRVYDDIGALETGEMSVAIGTLIDPQYLAGIGPKISFGVVALGRVTAQCDSNFSDAGINQTRHTMFIRVNADFSIQMLGNTQTVTVSADYPLSETVIVGDVPFIASGS